MGRRYQRKSTSYQKYAKKGKLLTHYMMGGPVNEKNWKKGNVQIARLNRLSKPKPKRKKKR